MNCALPALPETRRVAGVLTRRLGLDDPHLLRFDPSAHGDIVGGWACALPLARLEAALAGQPLEAALPPALRRAVRKRQLAFVGGRLCAERVLVQLGVQAPEVLRDAAGAPLWPAGSTGSISHTDHAAYAAAAFAPRDALGIDSELIDAQASAAIVQFCCTARERARWLLDPGDPITATLIFSAKEAYYKVLNRRVGQFMDFDCAEVVALDRAAGELLLQPTAGALAPLLPRLRVRFAFDAGPPHCVHSTVHDLDVQFADTRTA